MPSDMSDPEYWIEQEERDGDFVALPTDEREKKDVYEGVCPMCYHAYDKCSHCDGAPAPTESGEPLQTGRYSGPMRYARGMWHLVDVPIAWRDRPVVVMPAEDFERLTVEPVGAASPSVGERATPVGEDLCCVTEGAACTPEDPCVCCAAREEAFAT